MNNDKADFTQGSILKKLIAFMIPVLGALILQAAYGAVDLLVVGRFGSTSGLSAVSTGSQVLNLVTFVVIQFAMGITVLIARYLGEKKPQQIGAVVGGITVLIMRACMNTKRPQRSAGSYLNDSSYHLRTNRDLFLYSNVTKTRIQQESSSSGGGGSSVHTSSSGSSHGGGGGKF